MTTEEQQQEAVVVALYCAVADVWIPLRRFLNEELRTAK